MHLIEDVVSCPPYAAGLHALSAGTNRHGCVSPSLNLRSPGTSVPSCGWVLALERQWT